MLSAAVMHSVTPDETSQCWTSEPKPYANSSLRVCGTGHASQIKLRSSGLEPTPARRTQWTLRWWSFET